MPAEIQKADAQMRRTGALVVGAGALLGVVLLGMARGRGPALAAWVAEDVESRLRLVMTVLTLVTTGPVLGVAGYIWYLGGRVVRAGRYPPPRARVLRDTTVLTGQAAVRRGRLAQAAAAVLGLAAGLLAFFLWRLLVLLGG